MLISSKFLGYLEDKIIELLLIIDYNHFKLKYPNILNFSKNISDSTRVKYVFIYSVIVRNLNVPW